MPFTFKPLQLADLVIPKSLENLKNLGGVKGLLRGIGTNPLRGLNAKPTAGNSHRTARESRSVGRPASLDYSADAYEATIEDRQRIYGQNILPRRSSKSLLHLIWSALQGKVMVWPMIPTHLFADVRVQVLLSVTAVVMLALGLIQDFGTTHPEGEPHVHWVEGVAIIAAILIVVAVGSLNDWQKDRQFHALNEKKEDRLVKVIRDGEQRQIHVHQVVVGDVLLLKPGEVIPCDGVFLSGHNVQCDESSTTGESDAVKKFSYEECIALRDKRLMEFDTAPSGDDESVSASQRKTNTYGLKSFGHVDCFIVSGSRVLEGIGSYVAVSVGIKSLNSRIMMGSSTVLPHIYAL